MPRLVTKFKYMKPGAGKSVGGYAKYIATREGVEKIDDSHRHAPATQRQQELIEKLLHDFPDSKQTHEYEDYRKKQTVGSASEFISQTLEDNMEQAVNTKTYADYIATRPRAERFGSHGLFTDEGVQVQLSKVSQELNEYQGNVYTAILSLRREDAERLGFNSGSRWRDFLRGQTQTLSENLKIPMDHLKWYAAFHNESHHPHVHLIAYSSVPGEGRLTKQGVEKMRSALATEIFSQDLLCTYQQQTEYRDELRQQGREQMAQIVESINHGGYENSDIQIQLIRLADKLARTSGKKVYGYLKPDVKAMVDGIVVELAKDARIRKLYELWYEQREDVLRTYTDTFPKRIPLEQNQEFKSIRNAVIQEAMKITQDDSLNWYAGVNPPGKAKAKDVPGDPLPQEEQRETHLRTSAAPEAAGWKPEEASSIKERRKELEKQAKAGDSYAAYQLGKIYYFGMDVPRNLERGIAWLGTAAAMGNEYAEVLLQAIQQNITVGTASASIGLLRSLARMIQTKAEAPQQKPMQGLDRKQKREIAEKKQALGIRD